MAKCIRPIKLANRDESSSQGWNIVPCGKCQHCLARRTSAWAYRLMQENKEATSSHFITFTYEKEPLSANLLPTLRKSDFQRFLKRLRKSHPTIPYIKQDGSTGRKSNIKYYACGEYGTRTNRPHYHAIMFNINDDHLSQLEDIWSHGHVRIDPFNIATVSYVVGYLKKPFTRLKPYDNDGQLIHDDRQRHFSLQSKVSADAILIVRPLSITNLVWRRSLANLVVSLYRYLDIIGIKFLLKRKNRS